MFTERELEKVKKALEELEKFKIVGEIKETDFEKLEEKEVNTIFAADSGFVYGSLKGLTYIFIRGVGITEKDI